MTKAELNEYLTLKKKIARKRKELRDLEADLNRIVSDTVKGSSPVFPFTKRTIRINGIDLDYRDSRQGRYIEDKRAALKREIDYLLTTTQEIEQFIASIEDPRTREIFELKVLHDLTFPQISFRLSNSNKPISSDGIRKIYDKQIQRKVKLSGLSGSEGVQ